jgi:hypothetical protein
MKSLLGWTLMRVKLLYHTDIGALKQALSQKGIQFEPAALMDHVVYMFEI